MTIEEKAKAYDKALEKAQELYNNPNSSSIGKSYLYAVLPEVKESEDERIRKELISYIKQINYDNLHTWNGINLNVFIAWLEKCEQKHADKVEPKFHKGEWITNGDYTWQIVNVTDLDYILCSQEGNIVDDTISHVDEQFHSFTIEDAKDGDVLVDVYENIGVFEKRYGINWHTYCYLGSDGRFISKGGSHGSICYPATKEQRDLLFQKMREAGYDETKIKLLLKLK